MGIYTTAGKINTTTVNGLSLVGLHAADGGINIVLDDAVNTGIHHPSGAIRVNSGTGPTHHDASGAVNSNHLFGPGK